MSNVGETLVVRGVPLGGEKAVDVTVRDGRVERVAPAAPNPPGAGSFDCILGPPLFDIQVNGAGGINLQGPDVQPDDVRELTERLAAWGVSRWVPTLITASLDDMAHGCRTIADAMDDPVVAQAIPGIHLEGPFISSVDGPRGAHPREHVRPPDLADFDRLVDAARGRVLYTTIAPELPGAADFIRGAVDRGVLVSLGHHDATPEAIVAAAEAGARLCTHLGNGLASYIHRHQNPLWPQVADDHLTASLIADLHHLPAPMLKTLLRAKGPERIVLVSDAVHIAGLPPGAYSLGGHPVELTPAGRICLTGTDLLAGSALMLLQGLVNAAWTGGMTLAEAHASASTVPAALFNLPAEPFLEVGQPANFIAYTVDRTATPWEATLVAAYIRGRRTA